MNFVLPMSGLGSRFQEAGYNVPKPFIDVLGRPMIRKVMENLGWSSKFYLIAQRGHKELLDGAMLGCDQEWEPVYISGQTEGAACSVLKAKEFIDNHEMLCIANSDQLIDDTYWINEAMMHFDRTQADCSIICFINDDPKWSYARVEKGLVREVAEKRVVSNLATCGIYIFRHGKDFVRAAEAMITKNIRTNGEFYTAPAINELILENKTVVPYMVNLMYGIGDPDGLRRYCDFH